MTREDVLVQAREYIRREQHPEFRKEVEELLAAGNDEALRDRFYTDLEFGTGGLRGVIGGGFNRMNPYVVRRATQGLADYVVRNAKNPNPGAVIAYDSRRCSDLFALEAALTLCANGIRTYLFTSLRSTPELSFAVRHLKAATGIVVTASHNPGEYNGYKVYWDDGAQVVPPHDKGIIACVRAVTAAGLKMMTKDEAIAKGLLRMIDREIDDAYFAMVKECSLKPDILKKFGSKLKVVYTPLHGTGTFAVESVLKSLGVEVLTVPEQREPDGRFPTVAFPNPEEGDAMKLSLELARRVKADLVIGTDPDADRIGIAVPDPACEGGYRLVTGNQFGVLLLDHIITARKERGRMPPRPYFVNTIVTTLLQNRIARKHGVGDYRVLTGFKYIAELIRGKEGSGAEFIFGCEESYGFLCETAVRDKDGISAALMAVELAASDLDRGSSVAEHLERLYKEYGYYEETLVSKHFKGESGLKVIADLMDRLREAPLEAMKGFDVVRVRDVQDGTVLDAASGVKAKEDGLPSSNVIQFELADGSLVTARPSGTEPKVKFYASVCAEAGLDPAQGRVVVGQKIEKLRARINEWIPG